VGTTLPRLYPIVDAEMLKLHGLEGGYFAGGLRAAGVRLLQYRDKTGVPQEVLRAAALIREVFAGTGCRLIMNDRADLAVLAGWGGVHVGQGDLSPEDAVGWGFDAYGRAGSCGGCELCGLYRGWAGVCYGNQAGRSVCGGVGGCATGEGVDDEADCGDWWNYAEECSKCDRGGGGFGGGDQCVNC